VLQGGSIIRLFHKELEALLVAEGLFDDEISEDGPFSINFFNLVISVQLCYVCIVQMCAVFAVNGELLVCCKRPSIL